MPASESCSHDPALICDRCAGRQRPQPQQGVPQTISLYIKGTSSSAAHAAASRRIPFIFRDETDGVVRGKTSSEHEGKVRSWFNEGPSEAPFPAGTLLFFSTPKADP